MSDPSNAAATLTIDLGALVANWRLLAARARPARCGAVVKADAYGLGAAAVVRALLAAGCREYFVALVDEGIRLKQALGADWPADARLHVLHGPLPGAEADCLAHGLTPVLGSLAQIDRWQALARQHGRALPAALQGDTGMCRLGLSGAELRLLDAEPQRLAGIQPTLVMSHLVSAEEPDNPLNARQLAAFGHLLRRLPQAAGCLANSSGIFLGEAYHFDLVRPGAALYGVAPVAGAANPMQPVVQLQARLIQCREVAPGEGVGYNHTWVATRPSRIATVSVGYADGLLRSASNQASLRLDGQRVPLVGRVSMDTVTLDVTDLDPERLQPGTAFALLDAQHDVNALAAEAGTNAYEVLTSLGPRYHRVYLDAA